jgi:3-methyladenine DNA glycosylase/8-oxoguanine DNA glycosylase
VEQRTVQTRRPVDLRLTLGPLQHGGYRDPCVRIGPDDVWRAADTPSGPATMRLRNATPTCVVATAWGPGAATALDGVRDLIGADDDAPPLADAHPVVTGLARRLEGMRIGRTNAVLEALVPVVLAQRVIGAEASFAYRAMVRAAGRHAPGPVGVDAAGSGATPMLLPPEPRWLTSTPSWAFHRWGVEVRRAATIKSAAAHARRMDELPRLPVAEARRQLAALPGVGPWTVNNVAMLALGDPDAVNVGDYWLKHVVSFALTGEARGTDERMLALLEPWRGQRGRVCRLLLSGGPRPPRFGPRSRLRQIARH